MAPVRPLALWLAAAIVMIAVSLVPSAASAHSGHSHGAAPIAVGAVDHAPTTLSAHAVKSETAAAKAEARLLCSGPCCVPGGHVCSSCCSAGLMPSAEPAWTAPRRGNPHLARDSARPEGIVPEALPEPPRPFA